MALVFVAKLVLLFLLLLFEFFSEFNCFQFAFKIQFRNVCSSCLFSVTHFTQTHGSLFRYCWFDHWALNNFTLHKSCCAHNGNSRATATSKLRFAGNAAGSVYSECVLNCRSIWTCARRDYVAGGGGGARCYHKFINMQVVFGFRFDGRCSCWIWIWLFAILRKTPPFTCGLGRRDVVDVDEAIESFEIWFDSSRHESTSDGNSVQQTKAMCDAMRVLVSTNRRAIQLTRNVSNHRTSTNGRRKIKMHTRSMRHVFSTSYFLLLTRFRTADGRDAVAMACCYIRIPFLPLILNGFVVLSHRRLSHTITHAARTWKRELEKNEKWKTLQLQHDAINVWCVSILITVIWRRVIQLESLHSLY